MLCWSHYTDAESHDCSEAIEWGTPSVDSVGLTDYSQVVGVSDRIHPGKARKSG